MRSLCCDARARTHTHTQCICVCVCVHACECVCHFNFSTTWSVFIKLGRGQLKCDGTHTEIRFHLSVKCMSPFKSVRVSVQLTTDSRGMWRVLATHSIRQFSLHFSPMHRVPSHLKIFCISNNLVDTNVGSGQQGLSSAWRQCNAQLQSVC